MAIDPIHQFEIRELFPIVKIGNTEIAFTNSAAYMFVAVAVIVAFLIGGTITGLIMTYYYGFLFSIIVNSAIWMFISFIVNKYY